MHHTFGAESEGFPADGGMTGKPAIILAVIAIAAGSGSLLAQGLNSGLRGATPGASLWDVNLAPPGPDGYTAPLAGDRRHHPRFRCFISALVRVQGSQLPLWGQITDISQGGCYVQLAEPLKMGTKISLELLMKLANLRGEGVVCSSHAGRGMGIKFVEMTNEYRDQVRQFVKWFAGAEPVASSAEPDTKAAPSSSRGGSR